MKSRSQRGQRGAVYVEFLIVYIPVLLTFFSVWQLGELASANLVVKRATTAAARAATVVLPDDPDFYGGTPVDTYGGARADDIQLAAGLVLMAAPQITDMSLDVNTYPYAGRERLVSVRLSAEYHCLGAAIAVVCGLDGKVDLTSETIQAYHGAYYQYGF